jgi:UDP-N-acetyl-2-amino-2-deoxyglucuronate dehydrogenase
MNNFAIIGLGYIAPRHLQAIKDTNNNLVAALDKNDSVGILDKYFTDVDFFTEFERFDRYAEKLRKLEPSKRIHYVSICSPNYLHDAHIRFALRIGANAICEKPLVINPWNLDALSQLEKEYGKKVYTVLQLRLHPAIVALKKQVEKEQKIFDIDLTYIAPRGKWYFVSWKGDEQKSGGVAMNIGVHFFDMLLWIFGKAKRFEIHKRDNQKISGYLELERARVKWFLSIDRKDLSFVGKESTFRSLTLDGKEFEFSEGFTDLHTTVYKNILDGKGFTIEDARPSVTLVHDIREAKITKGNEKTRHPFLKRLR